MKPDWLKIRLIKDGQYELIKSIGANTICVEAHCPNLNECWSSGTASFMILGNVCTRGCRFCNVKSGKPGEVDKQEVKKIVDTIKRLKLEYVVITSVDRDDLNDGGANYFAECIRKIKRHCIVEVLIPDYDEGKLRIILDAEPKVVGHNIETVKRLQRKVRDVRASYEKSLNVLNNIKKIDRKVYTKSSIMLGLGESEEEVIETMKDLRENEVDILTLGQYLQPSKKHLEVEEFINPKKFEGYNKVAEDLGFIVAAGPFVRSSYKASELVWIKH